MTASPYCTPENDRIIIVAWLMAALLLGFLCLTHLFSMVAILMDHQYLSWAAPLAFLATIIGVNGLAPRATTRLIDRLRALVFSLLTIVVSVLISAWFYDLSWDGQWYHQTGIHLIEQDWNPMLDPLREIKMRGRMYVLHYSKGPWFIAAAIARTAECFEAGKCQNWIAMVAMLCAVSAACLSLGMQRARALSIAGATAIHPVIWSEITAYLVDGLLICYLTTYAVVLIIVLQRTNKLILAVGIMAALLVINVKFTGGVFLAFFCLAAFAYCLLHQRKVLLRFCSLHLFVFLFGFLVMGYSPYVTNTIHRGHPFYPRMSTKQHPSPISTKHDPIEKFETPVNMRGRSRFIRLAYALFGTPSNAPYNGEKNAEWMQHPVAPPSMWKLYDFHDPRISPLGPAYGITFTLGCVLILWLSFSQKIPQSVLWLGCASILLSILANKHLWWARYGPQIWLFPILPAAMTFLYSHSRTLIRSAWVLLLLLGFNGLVVAGVHMSWEVRSTHQLTAQLTEIAAQSKPIDIKMLWFQESIRQRLKQWGIEYQAIERRVPFKGKPLMSVTDGYPGGIYYRVRESPTKIEEHAVNPKARSAD